MTPLISIGKILIVVGALTLVFGFILVSIAQVPGFGKLPGDILIQKKNFTFYIPLVTSLVLSIVLSIILALFTRH